VARPAVRRIVALPTAKDGIARLANLLLAVIVVEEHAVGAIRAVTDGLETGDGVRRVVACSLAFLETVVLVAMVPGMA